MSGNTGRRGCGGVKKSECGTIPDCIWVPSKGCRVEDNLPLRVLAAAKSQPKKPRASAPKKCVGLKKAQCASENDCEWIPKKGCRFDEDMTLGEIAALRSTTKKPRATSPTSKKTVSNTCSKVKKADCSKNSKCLWVPSKGCMVEEDVPLQTRLKLIRLLKQTEKKLSTDATKKVAPKKTENKQRTNCSMSKKADCSKNSECLWIPSKGCRVQENVPLQTRLNLAKKRTPSSAAVKNR